MMGGETTSLKIVYTCNCCKIAGTLKPPPYKILKSGFIGYSHGKTQ